MCSVDTYGKLYPPLYDYDSSVGERPLPDGSTSYVLVSLGHTMQIIDNIIQLFEENIFDIKYTDK